MKYLLMKESYWDKRKTSFRYRLAKKILKRSLDVFLRPRDTIATDPMVNGYHEKAITETIRYYAKRYHDFFIDIGANIGLTSCQNGHDFDYVFAFEPNPLCFKILEVNCAINLESGKYQLFNYGLGQSEDSNQLVIPKHNWGGAFINDEFNSYSSEILASKDGFSTIDASNYITADIAIKNTEKELKAIFNRLKKLNKKHGVIKIDVEGYEFVVLSNLAKVLPADFSVSIIFESFDPHFDFESIASSFNRKLTVQKIFKKVPWKNNASGFIRGLNFKPTIYEIDDVIDQDYSGDLILEIA
jgi:FkbM family methyltransferase